MRIATYNVWNEGNGVGVRFGQLVDELCGVVADVEFAEQEKE